GRHVQSGVEACHGVQEILSVETHCVVLVHGRELQRAEAMAQGLRRHAHMTLGLHVAADGDVGAGHQLFLPRSMTTPTDLEPLTAPGLLRVILIQGTWNSFITSSATFSAKVSTRPNWLSCTNCCTRLATAL